jgi:hypothetical protein
MRRNRGACRESGAPSDDQDTGHAVAAASSPKSTTALQCRRRLIGTAQDAELQSQYARARVPLRLLLPGLANPVPKRLAENSGKTARLPAKPGKLAGNSQKTARGAGRPFQPGQSGNPSGRLTC